MIKGIDLGNGYTKFGEGKFASKVKIGDNVKLGKSKNEVHYVSCNNVNYIVGEGATFTGDTRYFTEYYKICLFTAIALNAGNEDFIEAEIVIGLPFSKHKKIGAKLKEHVSNFEQQQIIVDDKEYTIRIKNVNVFVEGAYPILTEQEEKILIIDMGQGTINCSLWEDMSVLVSDTFDEGLNKMFGEISSYLKTEKGAKIKPQEVEKILNKKTMIINNVETDISDIRDIIKNNITDIASDITNRFAPESCSKIWVMGGGGADTLKYWQDHFKCELVKDSQFINQRIYDKIANEKFGES